MYTIEEPYLNSSNPPKGTVPFFLVKDQTDSVVYSAVTRGECEAWIQEQSNP
jgi:hypothetical protein